MNRWLLLRRVVFSVVIASVLLLFSGCFAASESAKTQSNTVVSDQASSAAGRSGEAVPVKAVSPINGEDALNLGTDTVSAMEGINRKLIYHAEVKMEVTDFKQSEAAVRNLVADASGYVLNFSEKISENSTSGSFVLKIPSEAFESFLHRLEEIKYLSIERNVRGEDATEQYVDLEARLKARQTAESRLISFMENADTSEALLHFAQELAKVQEEIERIKGQMRYIDHHVAYSTINLHLNERAMPALQVKSGPLSLGERMESALLSSSNHVLQLLQSLLVFMAGLVPVLVLVLVVVIPCYWLWRKRRADRSKEASLPSNDD